MSSNLDTVPNPDSPPDHITTYFRRLAVDSLKTLKSAWQTVPKEEWDNPDKLLRRFRDIHSMIINNCNDLVEGLHPNVEAYDSVVIDNGDTLAGRRIPKFTQIIEDKIKDVEQDDRYIGIFDWDIRVCASAVRSTEKDIEKDIEDSHMIICLEEYNTDCERLGRNESQLESVQHLEQTDYNTRREVLRNYLSDPIRLNTLCDEVRKDIDSVIFSKGLTEADGEYSNTWNRKYTLILKAREHRFVCADGYTVAACASIEDDQIKTAKPLTLFTLADLTRGVGNVDAMMPTWTESE